MILKRTKLDKSSADWGYAQADALWEGLYAPYNPIIDGRVILDFGCSWGYLLRMLLEDFNPLLAIGTDIQPFWKTAQTEWTYGAHGDRLAFYEGDIRDNETIPAGSVDLILCTSVLQYLEPSQLQQTMAKLYEMLRPGGEMLLRTRCVTSHIGADMHGQFKTPYVHLLYPRRELDRHIEAETGRKPRYLNNLTASSYLAIFHATGFELADVKRRQGKQAPAIQDKLLEMYPWISREELLCVELECRLVRPIEPEELDHLSAPPA